MIFPSEKEILKALEDCDFTGMDYETAFMTGAKFILKFIKEAEKGSIIDPEKPMEIPEIKLTEIKALGHDVYAWKRIANIFPTSQTDNAVLFNSGAWIPKSQLAMDTLKNLWVSAWFWEKENLEI